MKLCDLTHPIAPEILRQLLDYEPETGRLVWRPRARSWFLDDGQFKCWNSRLAGKETGTSLDSKGYVQCNFAGRIYRGHRLAWAHFYGEWPATGIDHINGDRTDNRIANLRLANDKINGRNKRLRSDNSSGYHGVSWSNQFHCWHAYITDGKRRHLGSFKRLEDAVRARKRAERELGFHPNHGRAAA